MKCLCFLRQNGSTLRLTGFLTKATSILAVYGSPLLIQAHLWLDTRQGYAAKDAAETTHTTNPSDSAKVRFGKRNNHN